MSWRIWAKAGACCISTAICCTIFRGRTGHRRVDLVKRQSQRCVIPELAFATPDHVVSPAAPGRTAERLIATGAMLLE